MNYKIEMPSNVSSILKKLYDNGYEGYIVGGCVRDSLLNREPKDYDITTNAKPEEVVSLFEKVILTGIKHGTVTIVIDGESYEVTTYRNDGEYEDNRHPSEVEFVNDIREDLSRRDFTINAMAYNEKDGLIDYFNGIDDLNKKIIKTVGEPIKRFSEDALRMMRAVRFSAQLNFNIEDNTLNSISVLKENIKNISQERIREEFNRILIYNPKKIDILRQCGLLKYIINDLDKAYGYIQNNPYHIYDLYEHSVLASEIIEDDLALRLAMILHDLGKIKTKITDENNISHYYGHGKESVKIAEKILKSMKYDNNTIIKVITLIKYHDSTLSSKSSIKRMLSNIGQELFSDLTKVMWADILSQNPIYAKKRILNLMEVEMKYESIIKQKECFTVKDLKINGKDLLDLGIEKGRVIGEILNYLLDMVIENHELNTKEDLVKIAKERFVSNK